MSEGQDGFLLIRSSYEVCCRNCGWRGTAHLGREPVVTEEQDGADYCPVCGALSLIGADYVPKGRRP